MILFGHPVESLQTILMTMTQLAIGGNVTVSQQAAYFVTVTDHILLQGDRSGCVKPPVDNETKFVFQFQCMGLILKRNLF